MKKNINNYLLLYLSILIIFSYFFLYIKHQVGNDSTISEWFINYEGGFTRRGIIGQFALFQSRLFELDLRLSIFLLQCTACTLYFFLLFNLFKNIKTNKVIYLSIFTPIFILYPIAEIEVLARKEIIVFSIFLIYLFIPRTNQFKNLSLIIFLVLSILIWEPIIFFYPLFFLFEIIERNIQKANLDFFKIFFYFTPSIFIALFFITSPISEEQWMIMAGVLKNEFGQNCYMSCGLLNSKSTIIQQFQGNFSKYSFEVFLRYFLIIVIGFFPLHILYKNSFLKNKNLILFSKFKKIESIFSLSLIPVLLLFAMGYDWGRWVNITYVLLAIVYFYLYKNNLILLNKKKLEENIINKLKGKIFIFFFIVYCFGWNPKTVISGDVASFPGYRIPYKVFKVLLN
tara:strand:- start:1620 stop:2816 length:1197 start_codon:yes stop_codon:yes gene_type:complete